jgi:hypothetical protein
MTKRRLLIEELRPTKVEGVSAGGREADIMALPIEVEDGRRVFVFVLRGDERKLFANAQVEQMARTLGNTVHPSQAAFAVLPEGSSLQVWEVRG